MPGIRFTTIILALAAFIGHSGPVLAAPTPDSLVKGTGSAVYYFTIEGDRYVFPDEKTYFSWFTDFSAVRRLTDAEIAAMPLAGSVTYRPGIRMLKLQSDPKTYAVARGGILRLVTSESLAEELYGPYWNKAIDDLPDAFFANYELGQPIDDARDYSPTEVALATVTINADKGIEETQLTLRSDTEVRNIVDQWRAFALEDLNRIRAEHGKPALVMNPLLNAIASIHSKDMADHDHFAHKGSLGESSDDRIRDGKVPDTDYEGFRFVEHPEDFDWSGENLGQATMRNQNDTVEKTIAKLHQRFLDEAPDEANHRTTMLSTFHPFSQVGIGPYVDEDNNLWLTEDFISF